MRRTFLTCLLAAGLSGLALALPEAVRADVKPPTVEVALEGVPRAAARGEVFEGVIRIRSQGDWELTDYRLSGAGWSVHAFGASDRNIVLRGDLVQIAFEATPEDPSVPLLFEWTRNGTPESRSLDLSPARLERIRPRMAIRLERGTDPGVSKLDAPPYEALPALEETKGFLPWQDAKEGSRSLPRDDGDHMGDPPSILVTGQVFSHQAESGQYYAVPGVRVAVHSSAQDDPVVVWADGSGNFAVTIYRLPWDPTPDIQVYFGSWNEQTMVFPAGTFPPIPYTCQTEVFHDVDEDVLDVGDIYVSGELHKAAFYIGETVRRGRKYYLEEYGYDIPFVWTHFPDPEDGNYYIDGGMHISDGAGYNEGTILHEFGHFWNDEFIWMPSGWTYCNGICDFDGDCGHCIWCEESEAIAWFEGIASLFSRICTDEIKESYWMPSDQYVNQKDIHTIGDQSCGTPMVQKTEGFFSAVTYDLCDSDGPEDDPYAAGFVDRIEAMDHEVMQLLADSCPRYGRSPRWSYEFLYCFKDAYPALREEIWETARNNGFNIDESDPEAPTITNWAPPIWEPTTDATVWVKWNRAWDDGAGVEGYSISWTSPNPADPGYTTDIGDVTQVTSQPLTLGQQHYFNIRTKDRDNNWSDAYSSIGPFQILIPEGADLNRYTQAGWDYQVVPRKTPDAGPGDVHVSVNLEGGVANTYWNVSGKNQGDVPSNSCRVAVYVDDEIVGDASWPYLAPGVGAAKYNQGPVNVRAGRHIFGMFLDSEEAIAEQSETNNYRAGQWAWRAMTTLPEDQMVTLPAPPPPIGGWDYFGFEQPLYWNCDGHRSASDITFKAVYMYPLDPEVDYDLRIFGQTSLPETGFLSPIGESTRSYGALDAVIWNGLNNGLDDCNIGVYNADYYLTWGESSYNMERVDDELIGYGRHTAQLFAGQMLEIWSLHAEGPATLKLAVASNSCPPIHMGYFPSDFVAGGLMDAAQIAVATPGVPGVIQIEETPGVVGAVVVWRELDSDLDHAELVYLDYELDKPDVAAQAPDGWFAPIVPREEDIPYPWPTMDPPAHLTGNTQSTHLYFGEVNETRTDAGEHAVEAHVDGAYLASWIIPAVPAHGDSRKKSASLYTVRGGRHTLSMVTDRDDAIDELFEDNNGYGRQWVWSPRNLTHDVSYAFTSMSDPTGGWDEITDPPPGENPIYYNCDGLRTPIYDARDGKFAISYAIPDPTNDVDLRLHAQSTGAMNGFASSLASSLWRTGEADLVVADLDVTGRIRWDLGLVEAEGSGRATVQTDQSAGVIDRPGTYGPFVMERRDMVDLITMEIQEGIWPITVRQVGGDGPVDFGVSIHPEGFAYTNRSFVAQYDLLSWEAGSGEDETIRIHAYADGVAAIAVWRNRRDEANVELVYEIVWDTDTSEGPGEGWPLPTTTRLLPAAPNPFAGETTLWFDLAQPTEVSFQVYDVEGAVVLENRAGLLEPGRHPFVWNGRRNGGGEVPSGIYFVRMQAGEHSSTRRVLRIR